MPKHSDVMSLNRALTVALALSAFGVGAAYADDEYGTGHETLIRQSALSAPGARLSASQADMATEEFSYRDIYYIPATPSWAPSPERPHYATRGAMAPRDLVGDNGQQDDLARIIYTPGSGTDW